MNSSYTYRKPLRRSRYATFRRYLLVMLGVIIAVGGVGFYVLSSLHAKPSQPISTAQVTTVANPEETFTGPYFQFKDTGKWSFDKHDSTDNKFVYLKYQKNELLHQLNIYVNQTPNPLYLAVQRVLPLRIVNNNSFDITNISSPCGAQYAKNELHRVKELSINGAVMLCDPDNAQYTVVLSEINGNYQLKMVRPGGTSIQFVITYQDLGLDPQPDSLLNIASSFQTR
jgi:uncharacterized protein (UPF0333 family)